MAGAPQGNDNRVKGKRWQTAIDNALAKRGSRADGIQALDVLAEKLLALAEDGDLGALKELGDRLDGKAVQQSEISGPDGSAIPMQTVVNFVTPGASQG